MNVRLSSRPAGAFFDQHGLRLDPNFMIEVELVSRHSRILPLQIDNGRLVVAVPSGQMLTADDAAKICSVYRQGKKVQRFAGIDCVDVSPEDFQGALWRYFGHYRPGSAPPKSRAAATTFPVRSVKPGADPYPEVRLWEFCLDQFSEEVMGVSDFFTPVIDVTRRGSNHLLNAVYLAFCDHRPLVLSPDMLWMTLLQGLAAHFEVHAERLRPLIVSHEGKQRLVIERPDFVLDSLENPWEETFEAFCRQIRLHLQPQMSELAALRFSTTGSIEQAAFAVALMDICKVYFDYEMNCICGIPSISLEGTVDDWSRLRKAVQDWRKFDLDWWLNPLDGVLQQFEAAAAGNVDATFWNDIYQRHDPEDGYGGPLEKFTGWIGTLFPYYTGEPNPMLAGESDQPLYAHGIPASLSRASVLLRTAEGEGSIEFVSGMLGVEQLQPDLALRPKIGWLVHRPPTRFIEDDRQRLISRFRPEIRRHLR